MLQQPRPLLVIDDDPALCATLLEQLTISGQFMPAAASSLAEAAAMLSTARTRFDGILLDVGLPDGDGGDFCAGLRRQGIRMPIIMLTGSDAESDVVRGLDAGANDYVVKPFRLEELLVRLRAQLRAYDDSEDAVFAIGPYLFRPGAKLLREPATNRRIRLTGVECRLLKRLYRANGRTVSRKALMEEVWGHKAGTATRTIEIHIYRLRRKLEPCPSRPQLLLSEGGGYRLDPSGA